VSDDAPATTAPAPVAPAPPKRDAGGHWLPGASGNPNGRPLRAVEEQYLERVRVGCPPAEFEAIVKRAVVEAKKGGVAGARARDWLAKVLGLDRLDREGVVAAAIKVEVVRTDWRGETAAEERAS
jgi:hypothetical protein